MTEKEQVSKEMIDELGALLREGESLVIMLNPDWEVVASILDPWHTATHTVMNLASRIRSEKGEKNGMVGKTK